MHIKKNIQLLTWFNFFTDFKLYAPIAIIYFSNVSHSYALGTAVFSIAYIVSALFDIPTGIFADRIGRKKIIVLGSMTAVLYAIFYAIGGNFWILAIGAAFEGISRALYSGNNNALLHNMLSDEGMEHDYHEYLGKLSSMFQIALGISALLGAFIANWSFPVVMWLSVIPQIICLFIGLQITDSKKISGVKGKIFSDLKEGITSFVSNTNLRLLSISSILDYGIGETMYQFQAAFYNTLLPLWAVGIAKSLSNVDAALGFHFSGKIINKFGGTKILFFGAFYGKVINFISLLLPTRLSPFLMSTNSFFYGTGTVAENALMQKEFSDRQRATMSSLNSFGGSLFFGIFVFITGVLADKFGSRNALIFVLVCSFSTLWFLWKLYSISKKTQNSSQN